MALARTAWRAVIGFFPFTFAAAIEESTSDEADSASDSSSDSMSGKQNSAHDLRTDGVKKHGDRLV